MKIKFTVRFEKEYESSNEEEALENLNIDMGFAHIEDYDIEKTEQR